ncbi:MAG: hypothetical protein RL227_2448 [Pseudomonadota bacterium]
MARVGGRGLAGRRRSDGADRERRGVRARGCQRRARTPLGRGGRGGGQRRPRVRGRVARRDQSAARLRRALGPCQPGQPQCLRRARRGHQCPGGPAGGAGAQRPLALQPRSALGQRPRRERQRRPARPGRRARHAALASVAGLPLRRRLARRHRADHRRARPRRRLAGRTQRRPRLAPDTRHHRGRRRLDGLRRQPLAAELLRHHARAIGAQWLCPLHAGGGSA